MVLPSGYKELEYIEGTGTQCVNTGINANNLYGIKMAFSVVGLNSNWQSLISGNLDNFTVGSNQDVTIAYIRIRSAEIMGSANIGNNCELIIKNGTITINGNIASNYANGALGNSGGMVYIFNNSAKSRFSLMRLKSLEMYSSSGGTIRRYIPCENDKGNIGLWDDVNSQFYSNAGTGSFVAGPVVNRGGIFVKVNGVWKQVNNVTVNVR